MSPAKSKKQQQFFAMAAHGKLPKSKMPEGITHGDMMEFAETSTKKLPERVGSNKKRSKK